MIKGYEYADLFLENKAKKDFIITDGIVSIAGGSFVYSNYTYLLTNDDLKGDPKIHEILCDDPDIEFGQCNSCWIEFSVASDMTALLDKTVRVYVYLDEIKDSILLLGKYKVSSDKPTADRNYRDIVAYDPIYFIKKEDVTDWYSSIYPSNDVEHTIGWLRQNFCLHFGIFDDTDVTEMVNDEVLVAKTLDTNNGAIFGDTILTALCSANGGFGHINRMGNFACICLEQSIVGLYPSPNLFPAEDLYPKGEKTEFIDSSAYYPPLQYEDYYTVPISRVQIREDDDDLGVTVGEEGNDYVLEGNFLFYGMDAITLTGVAERLLGRITGITYMPFKVEAYGYPIFEVGDAVRLRTGDTRVNSYILSRVLSGTQALEDEYEAVGNKYREEKSTDLSRQVTKLNSRTIKIKTDVDNFSVKLEDLESDVQTEFAVMQGEIALRVKTNDVISAINLNSSGVQISGSKIDLRGVVTVNGNFRIDADGTMSCEEAYIDDAYLENCTIGTGCDIGFNQLIVNDNGGLELYGGGIRAGDTGWLVIDGDSSSFFSNLSIRADQLHLNYAAGSDGSSAYDTRMFHVSQIRSQISTSYPYIDMDGYESMTIKANKMYIGTLNGGTGVPHISIDYSTDLLDLRGYTINLGGSGTTLSVKGRTTVWKTITDADGETVRVLAEA